MSELYLDRTVPEEEKPSSGPSEAAHEPTEPRSETPGPEVETSQPVRETTATVDETAAAEGVTPASLLETPESQRAPEPSTGHTATAAPDSAAVEDGAPATAPAASGEAAAHSGEGDTPGDPLSGAVPARGADGDTAPADTEAQTIDAAAAPSDGTPAAETSPAANPALEKISADLAALSAALAPVEALETAVAELTRLRTRDIDLIDRLHADNTRLRAGELAAATAPLLQGLVRLHDQMASIAAGDQHSVAGMLRTQLLQLLEVAAGVTSYEPNQGDPFDPSRHTGAARVATTDPSLDNTIGRRLRPGFARGDGSILRVAEVEVLRHTPAPSSTAASSTDQKES